MQLNGTRGVLKGQEIEIRKAEELVRGDLDQESLNLVQENLQQDKEQIQQLNQLQDRCDSLEKENAELNAKVK